VESGKWKVESVVGVEVWRFTVGLYFLSGGVQVMGSVLCLAYWVFFDGDLVSSLVVS
jgi:hypothetical protein